MYITGMQSERLEAPDCSDAQLLMDSIDSLIRRVNTTSNHSPTTNEVPSESLKGLSDEDPYSDEMTNLILSLKIPRVSSWRILDSLEAGYS